MQTTEYGGNNCYHSHTSILNTVYYYNQLNQDSELGKYILLKHSVGQAASKGKFRESFSLTLFVFSWEGD